jgi:hypothetical protein
MDKQVGMNGETSASGIENPAPWPDSLRQRPQFLIERARELEKRFGDPVARLAELLSTLPPDDDPFWVEILEAEDF